MDVEQELDLLRARLEELERRLEGCEDPADPCVALVVAKPEGALAGTVRACPLVKAEFDPVEGAPVTFADLGATVPAAGLGEGEAPGHMLCVPIGRGRFVTLF